MIAIETLRRRKDQIQPART